MHPGCFLVFAMLSCAAPAWSAGTETRVRGLDRTAVRILAAAAEGSPTVRAMLDRLEASDLIVYVKFVPRIDVGAAVAPRRALPVHVRGGIVNPLSLPAGRSSSERISPFGSIFTIVSPRSSSVASSGCDRCPPACPP
jgi:hypothetical protein